MQNDSSSIARDPPPQSRRIADTTRSPKTKRFYERAEAVEHDGAFVLTLDGKPARTPAKHPLSLPSRPLAEAVAAEWHAQGAEIDPGSMPLTRLVNSAIDGVAGAMAEVAEDVAQYAGSDLTCYRAGEPEALVRGQSLSWDPILGLARERWGARFVLSQGVMFVEQPEAALQAIRAVVAAESSPFALAALHAMTTLTGSVLIALAVAQGAMSPEQGWAAAHVDERHQESLWGEDAEAMVRRAARWSEFRAAAELYRLSHARPAASSRTGRP